MKKVFLLLLMFLMSFCTKKSENQEQSSTASNISSSSSLQTRLDQFKPSITIHKVSSLDIATFFDIYTSFLENQIIWLRDPASQSAGTSGESEETLNQDAQTALEAQAKHKATFFQKWGISFDEFDRFSLAHSQEIQDYLSSHLQVQKRIEYLDRFLSSLQNSSTSQNEEYNYKDEDSIVDQTTDQEEKVNPDDENEESTPPPFSTTEKSKIPDETKKSPQQESL